MLASGHVAEYVFHWGNLYEHSQQGREAFNALVKSFFFRRTTHGGGRNKTRLKAIARWLQRRAIHMCGYDGVAIARFNNRLEGEQFMQDEMEKFHDDADEVDEDTILEGQVDVMDLYHHATADTATIV
jgi:hypothetical protein